MSLTQHTMSSDIQRLSFAPASPIFSTLNSVGYLASNFAQDNKYMNGNYS